MPTGRITKLNLQRGYGFIRMDAPGQDLFFHANSLDGIEFDETLMERQIEFAEEEGQDGRRRAKFVRAAR